MHISVWTVVSWMFCGLVVGLLARAVVPGRQDMGPFLTMGLGLLGACIGGALYWLIRGEEVDLFALNRNAALGWGLSVAGAAAVLTAYLLLVPRRGRP